MSIATFGYDRHGKTAFIAALTQLMENLYRLWPTSTWFPLDDVSTKMIRDFRRNTYQGAVPDRTTSAKYLRPIMIDMYDIPKFGDKRLLFYDMPGDAVQLLADTKTNLIFRPLKNVKSIWLIVSLNDLEDQDLRIADLLHQYLTDMEAQGLSVSGRNLIVVYTKTDKLIGGIDFPDQAMTYIIGDPLKNFVSLRNETSELTLMPPVEEYITGMKNISDVLEKYTIEHIAGGVAFLNLALRSGMCVYFTANSALGQEPVAGHILEEKQSSYRVLDALLWALYLEDNDNLSAEESTHPSTTSIIESNKKLVPISDHPSGPDKLNYKKYANAF